MRKGNVSIARRAWSAVALAVVLLVLAAPSVALAATTATFTSKAPASGSMSSVSRPTISVLVYDRYGVRGSANYSLTLDGHTYRPSISYVRGAGYTRFRLTFTVPAALASASHTVSVKVKDQKSKTSTASWSFTTDTTPPTTTDDARLTYGLMGSVHLTATDNPGGSGVAATCYRINGFLVTGNIVSLIGVPSNTLLEYWSVDRLGNTEAVNTVTIAPSRVQHPVSEAASVTCFLVGCHTGGSDAGAIHSAVPGRSDGGCGICHVTGPKTLTCTTAGCHSASDAMHQPIAAPHTDHPAIHSLGSCTQASCHGSDIRIIHAPVPGSGLVSSCQVCHGSSSSAVRAAIVAGGATCETCHASTLSPSHSSHASTVSAAAITILGATYEGESCASCHSQLELQHIHGENGSGNSCTKCHGGANPAGSAAPGDFDCSQAGCHAAASAQPMHVRIDASHSLATLPSCVGQGCHVGGTSVAAIHFALGRSDNGCGICHASGKTPTLVCATAGCHQGGLPTDHGSHDSTVTAADITILGTTYPNRACASCHGPLELQALHGENHTGNSCATCHPDPASSAARGDFSCAQGDCHAGASDLPMHGTVDLAHTLAVAPSCIGATCHTGGTSIVAIHAAVPGRSDGGCGICHSPTTTPTAVCATAGCHSPDDAFPLSTPHNLPALHAASPASADIQISTFDAGTHACSECHSPLDVRSLHGGDSDCATCHAPNVSTLLGGTSWNKSCVQGGCHSASSTAPMHATISEDHMAKVQPTCIQTGCHLGGRNVALIHSYVPGRSDQGCGICHAVGVTPTVLCATAGCHSGTDTFPYASAHDIAALHAASPAPRAIVIDGVSYGTHACSECHTPLDLRAIHGESGTNNSCATCHAPNVSTLLGGADWTKGCVQSGCHGPSSAAPAHGAIDSVHTLSAAPSCIGDGCHSGGTSVAAIHSVIPGRTDHGCGVCHASGITPTTDCTVCHGNGLPAGHTSHVPTVTAGAITINGTAYPNQTCSTCHNPYELQQIHGENGTNNSCVKCHPTPATSATSFNCSQPACHTTASGNMQVMHGNIDSDHAGIVPGCTVAGCHAGGSDVAAIHTVPGGPGCAACHAAGKTPTVVCATAGCHPNGGPDSHSSHDSTLAVAPITIPGLGTYTISCSRCHASNDLQVIHTSCATCHGGSNPAGSLPQGDFDCTQAGCHAVGSGQPMHGGLASVHDSATAAQCTTGACHGGGGATSVAVIHAQVPGRPDHGCGICHSSDPAKIPSLDCTAAGCHAGAFPPAAHGSHDSTLTSASIAIAGLTTYTYSCSECHASNDLQVIHTGCATCHGGSNPAGPLPAGDFDCTQAGCHAVSSSQPMHGTLATAHDSAAAGQCTTGSCHGGGGVTSVAVIHSQVAGRSDHGCGICHGSDPAKTPSLTCASAGCHAGAFPPATHGSHDSTLTAASITVTGVGTYTYSCSECHASNDLQAIHADCATCHGGSNPAGSLPAGDFDCTQAGCHAVSSSQPMHGSLATAHTATLPSGWTCTGTGCHAGGTNVAAIHFALNRSDNGCGICHSASGTPTADCQTAGCHADGGPASHSSHNSTVTVGTITINGTPYANQSCSTCHTTELQAEHAARVAGSGCSLCHGGTNLAGSLPKGDYDCSQAGCHAASSAQPMHPTAALNSLHTSAATSWCTGAGCHTGGTDVAAIHSAADVPKQCATCHTATNHATATCSTSGCHSSGDTLPYAPYSAGGSTVPHPGEVTAHSNVIDVTCNNGGCHEDCGECHGAPFSHDLPAIHAAQGLNCASCHIMGSTATKPCQNCHDISGMENDWML